MGARQTGTEQDIPGGCARLPNETLGLAEAGHRDLIQVRPPTEEEARFFALADNGCVAVLSCVRIAYRDTGEGPARFRVTCTVFPADPNEFLHQLGPGAAGQPAPAVG